jgi:hypothetical protein
MNQAMRRAALVAGLLGVVLGSACVGSVLPGPTGKDDPSSGGSPPPSGSPPGTGAPSAGAAVTPGKTPVAFACDDKAMPPAQPWRKLTAAQYRNTLRDLFTFALRDGGAAAAVMNGLGSTLARLPEDERQKVPQDLHGSYRRLDQEVEQLHVDVSYDVAVAAAASLTGAARIGVVVGPCATDGNPANDADCLTSFVQRFGERALRRPLAPDEVAFYGGVYGPTAGSDPAGYADVIAALLTAPQFLYQVEHGDAPVPGATGRYRLDAFELASRLAYQFWDTMPDDALVAAARSGALLTADGYAKEVDRVFKDPRTRTTLDDFFRDWLKLEDLKPLDARNADPVFKSFAAGDLPTATLRTQMIDDALALVRHFAWDQPGTFDDLLTTDLAFPRAAELARLYALPAWNGSGPPPAFPPGVRPGLLTRAAFLASGSANTRPIMKGVFVRENMLCDDIPPPPGNAAATQPALDGKLSTRQVVEGITEGAGTACAGCHATLINPIGFATEGFDALGRQRTEQRLFDDQGKELGKAALDTRSVPQIVAGDPTPSTGPADLMRLIAGSGKAQACFARHYLRFSFSRWEDLGADGCLLERLRQSLASKRSLADVLREVALAPEFGQRAVL